MSQILRKLKNFFEITIVFQNNLLINCGFHRVLTGIQFSHRLLSSGKCPCLDSSADFFGYRRKLQQLFGEETSQHEADLTAFAEIVADPYPYTRVVAALEQLFYVAEAVMPAVAAAQAHPDGAEREVDVVADHYEVLLRNLQLVHPVADGVSAQIHISGRLEQVEAAALDAQFGHVAVADSAELNIGRLSPGVQYNESDVVPCAFIPGTDVPESGDKEALVRHGIKPLLW